MRKLEKGSLAALETWKRKNPGAQYRDLVGHDVVKDAIRQACVGEQYWLCAYCCRRVTPEKISAHNEHLEAQVLAKNRTLDFSNMVASCNSPGSCGKAHASQPLPLTPLMVECETELQFELSGLVNGTTERARSTVKVLRLGADYKCNRRLISERKQMLDTLIYDGGLLPAELSLACDEVLQALLNDLSQPDNQSKLQAFSPVLINVIRQMRSRNN
ncbi:hypothetical protein [Pseudomonas syringae]|uniref:TIGR02646 family protein n=1 Tax=Pseudomonas syringae TaxID=317 RepID=A0A085VFG6_PSESX|nr:hypothetical protein [Pseudomonas syringae]KFE54179.1 hypothetical protein IV01_17345 [Pseudomonas syringae]